MKKLVKAGVAAAWTAAACTTAAAAPLTLDFEGITPYPGNSQVEILGYYNGGLAENGRSGPGFGAVFSPGAKVLCLNTIGTICSDTSKAGLGPAGSGYAAMYFDTTAPSINISAGLAGALSFWYSQPRIDLTTHTDVGIEIWDDLNGQGRLLTSITLDHTTLGTDEPACKGYGSGPYFYCPFKFVSMSFDGRGRSIRFTGTVNRAAFDDLSFDPAPIAAAPGTVPEPAAAALGLLALGALALQRRRAQPPGR